ncbi:cAMP-dependent protein kinase inhibitor alpha [Grus japonensis]|uniref:cAMP-dependent protein kinase inhibitor alpha n=1 Tax=Grus japonensis TaxID=30415 RepID=A0ABC9W1H5_GRUJA
MEDPTPEQVETPEGGCDPMESPHWSRLLVGPVDPWREDPTPEQDLALDLVELHEIRMGLRLNAVKVPLDGIPSLQRVDHTTQLGVIGKLADGALDPTVCDIDKDMEQYQA